MSDDEKPKDITADEVNEYARRILAAISDAGIEPHPAGFIAMLSIGLSSLHHGGYPARLMAMRLIAQHEQMSGDETNTRWITAKLRGQA